MLFRTAFTPLDSLGETEHNLSPNHNRRRLWLTRQGSSPAPSTFSS